MTSHSDFLPDDYNFDDLASMHTLEKLETMIRSCSLNNKETLLRKVPTMNESEALEMMQSLKPYMPIMGREATPHSIREQSEAIKNSVELDDFQEWKRKQRQS